MKYKCLYCNKNYQQKFVEKLKERFLNTHKYFLTMITKIVLLLQKGVFSYEYMNDCVKFNETSLPGKKILKSYLNTEDITDTYYTHAKKTL